MIHPPIVKGCQSSFRSACPNKKNMCVYSPDYIQRFSSSLSHGHSPCLGTYTWCIIHVCVYTILTTYKAFFFFLALSRTQPMPWHTHMKCNLPAYHQSSVTSAGISARTRSRASQSCWRMSAASAGPESHFTRKDRDGRESLREAKNADHQEMYCS